MDLNRVGIVGWRGMVGSVLMQRMIAEDDHIKTMFDLGNHNFLNIPISESLSDIYSDIIT